MTLLKIPTRHREQWPVSVAKNRESGAALVIALILVLVSTLLGISGMETSSIETRLANNEAFREATFRVAELQADQALESMDIAAKIDAGGATETMELRHNDNTNVKIESRMDGFAPLVNASLTKFRTVKVSVMATAKIDSVNTSRTVAQGASQRVPNQLVQ